MAAEFIIRLHCGTIMAMSRDRHKSEPRPLDSEGLERLALFYAGRYATTRAKLGTMVMPTAITALASPGPIAAASITAIRK